MKRYLRAARRRGQRVLARIRATGQRRRLASGSTSTSASGSGSGSGSGSVVTSARQDPRTRGTLRVLAHQDDDLLFQSVSLAEDVDERRPLTTLYLTAGDDDDDDWYWRAREAGIRAAYASLVGVDDLWLDDLRPLGGAVVTQATLAAAPRVRLLFLRLPDGGVDGAGGSRSGGASLRRLWEGAIATITAVDGGGAYSLSDLHRLLDSLVDETRPDRILTLDHVGTFGDGDHSDHHVVAYLAERVYAERRAAPDAAVEFAGYRGYTIEGFPENLSAGQIEAKRNAFFVYAKSDYKTCSTVRASRGRAEGLWLSREYEAIRSSA